MTPYLRNLMYENITNLYYFILYTFNPLSVHHEYIRNDTVVTSDSCNSGHSENWHFLVRAWNFLQNGVQNFVFWLIQSWEIALQSQIFESLRCSCYIQASWKIWLTRNLFKKFAPGKKERKKNRYFSKIAPVSYTHLTLPTICSV